MLPALLVSLACASTPHVEVRGNAVLPDDVYRTVLTLSSATSTTSSTTVAAEPAWLALSRTDPEAAAREVRSLILDFLLASGYELARVQASVGPDGVLIDIDEGQLDKIIFLRENTLSNIELRFALHLPEEIFNRPLLEQKLAALVEDSRVTAAYWELVPTQPVEHVGIQVEEVRLIRGLRLLNPGSHHELHIRLERKVRREGLNLGLGINGSDGFYTKAGYRLGDVFLSDDRLEMEARVGFYLGNAPESDNNPLGISRGQAKLRWSPIGLGSDSVRSFVEVDGNLFGRLRDDLAIQNYYFMPIAASLVIQATILEAVELSLGAGAEQRFLFGLDATEETEPLIAKTPDDELRYFIAMSAEWVMNPKELRADRRHFAALRGRFLGNGEAGRSSAITKVFFDYENVHTFGFDELRYGLHAAHQWGKVPFYDELSIGDGFLRSGFGTQIYTNRAVAAEIEYRISLSRDTLKLSVFNDAALYDRLDDLREHRDYAFADTFGGGVHVLLFDAFQINTYLGVTIDQHLGLDLGVKAELTRAF